MANSPDYTKVIQDAAAAFRIDPEKLQDTFQTSAGYGERFSKVAFVAAQKSTELSAQWTREMLAALGDVTKAKDAPADYSKAMTDFAAMQAELMSQHLAQFAEIAKAVQAETVDLMMTAAKSMSADAGETVRKASSGLAAAAAKVKPKL